MTDKVLDWLLDEKDPSIRFLTLTKLLGKEAEDPMTLAARKAIMESGPVPEILEMQSEDGSWGLPERFYNDKYRGTVWTLLILAELNADPADFRVRNACEFILAHSQEPENGGFSYTQSAKSGAGLPSGVIPCLTGNMVYALVKLGYLHDMRVQKAIDWIVRWQRSDDGDAEPPAGKVYERYEMCWGRHSCHMGVAKTLKGLASIPSENRSPEIANKTNELVEYFLKHHLYKKSHDLSAVARPGWLKPGFPLMYQTDILELLDILTDLRVSDPRMQEAVDVIKGKQTEEGKWKLENSFNGKMPINIEKKGQPSKWLTLKALKVLKEYRNDTIGTGNQKAN